MTITLDLAPDVAARLQQNAARRGQAPTDYIAELINEDADPDALGEADVAAIRAGIARGLEDGAAGRVTPFEEWVVRKRQQLGLTRETE